MNRTSKEMTVRIASRPTPRVIGNELVGTMSPLKHFWCVEGVTGSGTEDFSIVDAIAGLTFVDTSGNSTGDAETFKCHVPATSGAYSSGELEAIPTTTDVLMIMHGSNESNGIVSLKLGENTANAGRIHLLANTTGTVKSTTSDSADTAFQDAAALAAFTAGDDHTFIYSFDQSGMALTHKYQDSIASEDTTTGVNVSTCADIPLSIDDGILAGNFYAASVFYFADNGLPADYISQSLWMGKLAEQGIFVFPKHWANL